MIGYIQMMPSRAPLVDVQTVMDFTCTDYSDLGPCGKQKAVPGPRDAVDCDVAASRRQWLLAYVRAGLTWPNA